MSIGKSKKSVLHVAKAKLHMEDADYRALLQRAAGVTSSTDLDEQGFEAVMAEMERLGFRSTKGRSQAGRREGMATASQVGKIRALWQSYSGNDDDLRLGRWLERHFHVSHVRFLEGWRAGKAIAVLLKMASYAKTKSARGAKDNPPRAA